MVHTHTSTRAHAHTTHTILLSDQKDEILSFAATWMELEGIMLSEISQRKTNII